MSHLTSAGPRWPDTDMPGMLPVGSLLDFAVIWDEDHDERVIQAIEDLYFCGLLAPVRFVAANAKGACPY